MGTTRWAIGVDVGGTRLSVGLVSECGELESLQRVTTPRKAGASETIAQLLRMVDVALGEVGERAVAGIGVGFGGPVDFGAQRIRWSHHAPGWAGIELARVIGERYGLPAVLENDANAAGLAEATFGAGVGYRDVLYVNIGTGVGGALILGGQVHHGAHSNAGELGHMVLQPDGPPCPCGKRGCVEALCSGDAIGRMARERAQAGAHFGGLPTEQLTGRAVGELAIAGEPDAVSVVTEAAGCMGLALAGAANLLDPDVIVLGGGVPELGERYVEPVWAAFVRYAMSLPASQTPILTAKLGYEAGVIGAGLIATRER